MCFDVVELERATYRSISGHVFFRTESGACPRTTERLQTKLFGPLNLKILAFASPSILGQAPIDSQIHPVNLSIWVNCSKKSDAVQLMVEFVQEDLLFRGKDMACCRENDDTGQDVLHGLYIVSPSYLWPEKYTSRLP